MTIPTSHAKEITFDGTKPNQLDSREGITQEFNNNSNPFIIQENIGRTEEGAQKGGRDSEGNESFNSTAMGESKSVDYDQRIGELKERYEHTKDEGTENSRSDQSRQICGNESITDQRLEQLKERYDTQEQNLEQPPELDNEYSL